MSMNDDQHGATTNLGTVSDQDLSISAPSDQDLSIATPTDLSRSDINGSDPPMREAGDSEAVEVPAQY